MNDNIINQFRLLIKQIKFDIDFSSGKQQLIHTYRLKSIQNVLKIIENYKQEIKSSEQLKDIKGVGERSLERIDEILKTGKLAEIKISDDIDKYLNIITELEDIIGIGRKKAYELFKKHNITSIDDLQKKYDNNEINLPDNIIKGLKYAKTIKENIPRTEIEQFENILMKTTMKIDPQLFGVVCGSYRRQKETSGDIDFIITHTALKTKADNKINYIKQFVDILKKKNIIIDSLTQDDVPTKYMGICQLNQTLPYRRIDIRFIQYDSFYYAILYFTGSKDFNRKMRQVALTMGYTLNEYGLFDKNNNMFKVESEYEIFELLGMEYLTPDKRN